MSVCVVVVEPREEGGLATTRALPLTSCVMVVVMMYVFVCVCMYVCMYVRM